VFRSTLSDGELLEEVRRYNGTPSEVLDNPELRDLYLPLLRSDFRLAETYRFPEGARLRSPLHVLGGQDDPLVPADELPRWQELSSGAVRVDIHPGDHFFLRTQEVEICEQLSRHFANPPVKLSSVAD
jgi:surfactin synthase thioesterase subunit